MSGEGEQLRNFVENTPMPVAMLDREMRYVAVSRRWRTDFRLGDRDLLGRSHYEVFPDAPERWREVHRRALAGAIEHGDDDSFVRGDGTTDWVRWSVVPWRDTGGEIGGLMILTEVITERKRLEARVRETEKLASLGRLVGGVAHDFNNLLSVILGNAELALASESDDAGRKHSLTQIRRAAVMASELTDHLVAFGRVQPLRRRPRAFDEALERAAPMLEQLLPANVHVVWRRDAQGVWVSFDDTLVSMGLMNLLLNARDAMPEGGTLKISTELVDLGVGDLRPGESLHTGLHVRCAVTDTGSGMDAALLRRVRDPYFTTKERGRGTGLGLASAAGVVEQHRGALRLSSAPGKGTTAAFLVPICAQRPDPEPALPAPPEPVRETARILVVEDVPELRDFVRRVLEASGFEVDVAADAEEALIRWTEIGRDVDLVIADLVLPGTDGAALCKRLLRSRPDLRLLFTSGYHDTPLRARGSELADVPLLGKPFGASLLVARVHECLGHKPPPGLQEVVSPTGGERWRLPWTLLDP